MKKDNSLIEKKVNQIIAEIETELDIFLQTRAKRKVEEHSVFKQFYKNAHDFIKRGGKRIRPLLFRLGFDAVKGNYNKNINLASCSVELLHNSSLIHDDVVDQDEIRRGGPTVHVLYRDLYKEKYGSKIATNIGNAYAILCGNSLWNLGLETLFEAKFEPHETLLAIKRYKNMFERLVDGVVLEESMARGVKANEELYLKMVSLKTSTLLKNALEIGGILGKGSENQIEALGTYGLRIGQAFQIQDDILGSFGIDKKIGKPVDSDIKGGKQTIIAIKAKEAMNSKQKKILDKYFDNQNSSKKEIEAVRQVFIETGALEYSKQLAEQKYQEAIEVLYNTEPAFDSEIVEILEWVAGYIIKRKY
ncbi:MAG: polyprenyl synthetase family protein [Candidatus Ranarchaeia archaeon]